MKNEKLFKDKSCFSNLNILCEYFSMEQMSAVKRKIIFLAYTQVATLSVYAYLFSSVFGHQFLEPRGNSLDKTTFGLLNITTSDKTSYLDHTPVIYVPIFPILVIQLVKPYLSIIESLYLAASFVQVIFRVFC